MRNPLYENFLHDVAVNVGEAEIAAGVAVGEFFVVEAHHVQEVVEAVNVDAILNGLGTVIVGHAVGVAAANAAAGQPDGEGIGVVVAAGQA